MNGTYIISNPRRQGALGRESQIAVPSQAVLITIAAMPVLKKAELGLPLAEHSRQ
jgi:hypothetical protein